MGVARQGEETYRIVLADSAAMKAEVHALRASEYAVSQPYLRATDSYDERSYLFGCWSDRVRAPVATCRFTTPLAGGYELDELATGWTKPPVPGALLLETSRVVVRRDHRATGLVEAMLLVAGSWLLTHTAYRFNFAVCARPLMRLYARLGMHLTTDRELVLRGRPQVKRYVVIYGDMATSQPRVLDRLARSGWDLTLDVPEQKVGT